LPKRYNYARLLEDSDFKRWYENHRRGSPVVAEEKLRRIGYVCRNFNLTPGSLASMKSKEATNLIFDVVSRIENQGGKGSYARAYVKALKSWFEFNSIQISQKVRISRRNGSEMYAEERVPTPDELRRIFSAGDLKEEVACSLLAFSGVRPETLGNFRGDDGLKISDLPEMEVLNGNQEVRFLKVPTTVIVRPTLSKAGHQYFSFYAAEGCEYLKMYLEWRMKAREKLSPESPVITPAHVKIGSHISTTNVSDTLRTPIRDAGFRWRPYVLRRYFDTRMMVAEHEGLIIRDFRVFWMGHRGDIEHTYTLNKALPQDIIDRLRDAYAKAAERHMVTNSGGINTNLVLATFNRQFLKMAKYVDEEIQAMGDLSQLTPERLQELVKRKSMEMLGLNGNTQKVIPTEELEKYIMQGWEFVKELNSSKAIIRLPR
jgi:hypothetical protein